MEWSYYARNSKSISVPHTEGRPPWTSTASNFGSVATSAAKYPCRPWERGDLLRRLATYSPSNWLGKPKIASSLTCAQRGWINTDTDKVACEICGAYLSLILPASMSVDEVESAAILFSTELDAGHKNSCPWRSNSCPESLAQFPPTSQPALVGGYNDRCDGLLQFQLLPIVAASAIEHMRSSCGVLLDRFLSQLHSISAMYFKSGRVQELEASNYMSFYPFIHAQRLISLCGWESRWLPSVQDCEENSAHSTQKGKLLGASEVKVHCSCDSKSNKKMCNPLARKDKGKKSLPVLESRGECDSLSPLLDCSLCGATVRILDFATVSRPACFDSDGIRVPGTGKKMASTHGASAASGVCGRLATDGRNTDRAGERDETATMNSLLQVPELDLNLTISGLFSASDSMLAAPDNFHLEQYREMGFVHPSCSEVGDRATSYESRGLSSRKRSLEVDEVTNEKHFNPGPSRRGFDSDLLDTHCSFQGHSSGAGPSNAAVDRRGRDASGHGGEPLARNSTCASSVIAIDTICHTADGDSMESVENQPGDMEDVNFPSSSTYGNLNEASEVNNSNYFAQTSTCLQADGEAPGEMGVSSTNDGDVLVSTAAAHVHEGFSFGVSGGSFGMCSSHEAEIHGANASVHRSNSTEPRVDDPEHQVRTGESVPGPGVMGEIVPDDIIKSTTQADSYEMMSRSMERADSGSKVDGSVKAESVESGDRTSQNGSLTMSARGHILSCYRNGCPERSEMGTIKVEKSSSTENFPCNESDFVAANGASKGTSNSGCDAMEFDPIAYHNKFCPWVNANVAAAGIGNPSLWDGIEVATLCGWQLTLKALDVMASLGQIPLQDFPSESAASLHKGDTQTPGKNLIRRHSTSRSHGKQ